MEHILGNYREEALDKDIFPIIQKNNSQYRKRFHIDNYLEFKKSFTANDFKIIPEYRYLNDPNFDKKIHNLQTFEQSLINDLAIHPVVKTLYIHKIHEKKVLLTMVRMAYKAQVSTHEGVEAQDHFKTLTEQVFSQPKIDIFNQLCTVIEKEIENNGSDLATNNAYATIKNIIANKQTTSILPYVATKVHTNSTEIFETDATVIVEFFKKRMNEIGLADWNIKISDKAIGSFRVQADKKNIFIPKTSVLKSRKNNRRLTPDVIEGLFNHEILTHVIRAVNGANSILQLLSQGLEGYLKGEEGIATYREQLFSHHTDYSGGTMYFTLGLAYGLDRGGEMRNFSEVYKILCDYFFLKYHGRGYKSKAFSACARIFIFTADPHTQLIFTRDTVYREGNIEIYQLMQRNPAVKNYFDIGKFDPSNSEHVITLQHLGILPSNLSE